MQRGDRGGACGLRRGDDLRGGQGCRVGQIESRRVDHAVESESVGGKLLDEPAHVVGMVGREPNVVQLAGIVVSAADDHTAVAARAQLRAQARADTARILEQDPVSGLTRRDRCAGGLGWPGREQHGLDGAVHAGGIRHARDTLEAGGREHFAPAIRGEEAVVGTQVGVGEAPPSLRHPEDEIEPGHPARRLEQRQQASRREQCADVAQRRPDIRGRVHHVGRDDHVE